MTQANDPENKLLHKIEATLGENHMDNIKTNAYPNNVVDPDTYQHKKYPLNPHFKHIVGRYTISYTYGDFLRKGCTLTIWYNNLFMQQLFARRNQRRAGSHIN